MAALRPRPGDQGLDVVHVGEPGILGAGRSPERALDPGAPGEQGMPAWRPQRVLEGGVGRAGIGDRGGAPERGRAARSIEQRIDLAVQPADEEAGHRLNLRSIGAFCITRRSRRP